MSKINLLYTILSYRPSSIRRETMNVGIVIHIPQRKFSRFIKLKSKKRLEAFDDEYDADFFNLVMDSMYYQFEYPKKEIAGEYSEFEQIEFKNIESENFLIEKTKYYANEFQFFTVQGISVNDDDETIKQSITDLSRTFLYYDQAKKNRITKEEIRKLFSGHLRYNKISGFERNPKSYVGDFDKKPIFDYEVGNTLIKILTFDYARPGNLAKELKSAIYDIEHVKTPSKRVMFVINNNAYTDSADEINEFRKKFPTDESKYKIIPVSEFMAQNFA